MNEYVKAVLYAYPLLKNVEKDYIEHIQNRAILSYRSDHSAELVAEKIAEDILEKQNLQWLKEKVECVLDKLNTLEKTLVSVKYFGKKRKMIRVTSKKAGETQSQLTVWSERKYFRMQERLFAKVAATFKSVGVTEQVFFDRFAGCDIINRIYRFVCKNKARKSASGNGGVNGKRA